MDYSTHTGLQGICQDGSEEEIIMFAVGMGDISFFRERLALFLFFCEF